MKNILSFLFLIFFCLLYFAQGRVGINTEKPTNTLDVNGNIRIRTTEEINNIPEFVLTPDDKGVVRKTPSNNFQNNSQENGLKTTIASLLGFKSKEANTINYLSNDLGSQIRIVKWDSRKQNDNLIIYDSNDFCYIIQKEGYYEFIMNLVSKSVSGNYTGFVRLGLSIPFNDNIPYYTRKLDDSSFAFFSQKYSNISSSLPINATSSGTIYLKKGQKIYILTKYIDPAIQTFNIEEINYDRTLVNSVVVNYYIPAE